MSDSTLTASLHQCRHYTTNSADIHPALRPSTDSPFSPAVSLHTFSPNPCARCASIHPSSSSALDSSPEDLEQDISQDLSTLTILLASLETSALAATARVRAVLAGPQGPEVWARVRREMGQDEVEGVLFGWAERVDRAREWVGRAGVVEALWEKEWCVDGARWWVGGVGEGVGMVERLAGVVEGVEVVVLGEGKEKGGKGRNRGGYMGLSAPMTHPFRFFGVFGDLDGFQFDFKFELAGEATTLECPLPAPGFVEEEITDHSAFPLSSRLDIEIDFSPPQPQESKDQARSWRAGARPSKRYSPVRPATIPRSPANPQFTFRCGPEQPFTNTALIAAVRQDAEWWVKAELLRDLFPSVPVGNVREDEVSDEVTPEVEIADVVLDTSASNEHGLAEQQPSFQRHAAIEAWLDDVYPVEDCVFGSADGSHKDYEGSETSDDVSVSFYPASSFASVLDLEFEENSDSTASDVGLRKSGDLISILSYIDCSDEKTDSTPVTWQYVRCSSSSALSDSTAPSEFSEVSESLELPRLSELSRLSGSSEAETSSPLSPPDAAPDVEMTDFIPDHPAHGTTNNQHYEALRTYLDIVALEHWKCESSSSTIQLPILTPPSSSASSVSSEQSDTESEPDEDIPWRLPGWSGDSTSTLVEEPLVSPLASAFPQLAVDDTYLLSCDGSAEGSPLTARFPLLRIAGSA